MAMLIDGGRTTSRPLVEAKPKQPAPAAPPPSARLLRQVDGFDRPASAVAPTSAAVGGKPATPETGKPNAEYRPVEGGELFVRGEGEAHAINASDISQGAANDCWFLSSLATVAREHPEKIEENIQDNGDGTYTVTFHEKRDWYRFWEPEFKEVKITVDGTIPQDGSGNAVFAKPVEEGGKPETWVAIYEKAYAEYAGGYPELQGNNGTYGMELLFGAETSQHKTSSMELEEVQGWLEQGDGVTAISLPSDRAKGVDAYEDGTLMAYHVYYITDVDVEAGTVDIQNPHGWSDEPITMSWSDYQKYFVASDRGQL